MMGAVTAANLSPDYSYKLAKKNPITSRSDSGSDVLLLFFANQGRSTMKSRNYKWLVAVATLVSLVFVVSNASAKKPAKPPPDPDQTTAECIVFTGEYLQGGEEVEGCCPNAGPWPAYKMLLDGSPYEGQLFINFVGAGPKAKYRVQFWSWDWDTEVPGIDDIFFEIIGGAIDYDKKSKFLTVSFEDEEATLWLYGVDPPIETNPMVSFDLLRTADLSFCE